MRVESVVIVSQHLMNKRKKNKKKKKKKIKRDTIWLWMQYVMFCATSAYNISVTNPVADLLSGSVDCNDHVSIICAD